MFNHRTFQWMGIITVALALAGGYFYWQARAGGKLNAPQTGTLTSGLVGYWTFDGADSTASTVTDKSGSGNNGTLNNSPQKVAGKVGQALNFFPNGSDTNSRVNMGDPAGGQLDFGSGDFSVGFWMKNRGFSDQTSSVNVALAKRNIESGVGAGYSFQYANTNLMFFAVGNGSSAGTVTVPKSIADNEWHYYIGLRSGSTIYLYVDGVSVGSASISGSTSNSEIFTVGADDVGANGNTRNANADIDEVRVYNRALASTEIQSLYDLGSSDKINSSVSQNQGGGTLSNGLAGYWALDENAGTSTADASVNANTGTLTSGPTWTTGQIGSAVNFDGVNDTITTTNGALTDKGSVSAWVQASFNSSPTGSYQFFTAGGSGTFITIDYNTFTDHYAWTMSYRGSFGTQQEVKGKNNGADDTYLHQWHHVVATWDVNKDSKMYVDGVLEGTYTGTTGTVTNANSLTIGATWAGKIDEVRRYTRELSAEEVIQLYRLTTPTNVDTSLKGYWSFDGKDVSGTTAYDWSGAGNNGTLTNGPTVTPGVVGQALSFDGTNDYMVSPNNSNLDFSYNQDFSVALWVKIPSTQNNTTAGSNLLVQKWLNTGPYPYVIRVLNQTYSTAGDRGKIYGARWDNTNNPQVMSSVALNDNIWHHISFIKRGSALEFYVDGVLNNTATDTTSGTTTNGYGFYAGAEAGSQYYLTGSLDDIRVYRRALASTEIQSLYASGQSDKINSAVSTPQGTGRLDSGLAGYWKFDDGSGTSATDATSNGNTLTLSNSPTWSAGKIGTSLTFFPSGSDANAMASVADPASGVLDFGSGDFAVSFWAKGRGYTAQGSSGNMLVGKKNVDSSSAAGWYFGINSSSIPQMNVNNGGSEIYPGGGTALSDDVWHYLVGLRTGSTVKLYCDGVRVSSGTLAGSVSNANSFWVGDDGTGIRNFKGEIDEVRTYNRALSEDEISQLYRLTNPTNIDTSLKGYWSFNGQDVSGTTAYDRSGSGNNGTLTNGPTVTPGKVGQALQFSGTANVSTTNTSDTDFTGSITLSVWANGTPGSGYLSFISKVVTNGATNNPFDFGSDNSATPKLYFTRAGTDVRAWTGPNTVPGSWHHYVVTSNTSDITVAPTFYVDGVASTGTAAGGGGTGNATGSGAVIKIGRRPDGVLQMVGALDEVRIYNRVLSSTEIASLYNSGR